MKCCSLHEVLSFINLLVKNNGGGQGRGGEGKGGEGRGGEGKGGESA